MADDTYTSSEDEKFFAAIGRLTIAWGYVDVALDLLVYETHTHQNGKEIIEPDPPASLKRKIKYLRKAFRLVPKFAPFNERFTVLADGIVTESKTRHDIIHGFILQLNPSAGKALMVRWPPGEYRGRPFVVTTTKILEAARRTDKLRAFPFAQEVLWGRK